MIADLRENLRHLEEMRAELPPAEYESRRQLLLQFEDRMGKPATRDDKFRIAAWILAPLGLMLAGTGTFLGLRLHPLFWIAGAIGAVLVCLSLSFAYLAHEVPSGESRVLD